MILGQWRLYMKYKAIYWFILSPFIKSYLNIHFSKSQTKEFTKKAKSFYKDLLAKADDIGEKNPMASNLYFALLLFSFFLPNKANISLDMFKDLMNYYFISQATVTSCFNLQKS